MASETEVIKQLYERFNSRDIEANKKIFVGLGGTAVKAGDFDIVRFPGVNVYLNQRPGTPAATGGTVGSVINHAGFLVPNVQDALAKLKKESSNIKTFSLDGGIKDVKQMLAEGHKRGLDLPLLKQTLACYEEAQRHVGGKEEVSNVSVYWAGRSK